MAMRKIFLFLLFLSLQTLAQEKPAIAQITKTQIIQQNPNLQAADRELDNLSKQSIDIPIFARKAQLNQLAQRYQRQNHKPGFDRITLELAWVAYQDANYNEVDRHLRQIEFSFPPNSADYWRMKSLTGLLQSETGRPQLALHNLLMSYVPFHSWNHQQIKQVGLANTYRALGQYHKASVYAETAARSGSSRVSEIEALQVLGDIAFEVGQFKTAIDRYKKASLHGRRVSIAYGRRSHLTHIQILTQLARAYQAIGNLKEAQNISNKALDFATQTSFQEANTLVLALNAAAMVNLEAGDNSIALTHLQRAQQIIQKNPVETLTTLLNLGHFYQTTGDFNQSKQFYSQALEFALRNRDRVGEARAQSALGQLELRQQKTKSAIQALSQSIKIFESLRQELRDAERLTIAETQAKTYELLQIAYIQDNNSNQALIVTERARAQALVELLAQRNQTNASTPEQKEITLESIQNAARSQNATIVTYSTTHPLDRPNLEDKLNIWVIQPNGNISFKTLDIQKSTNASQNIKENSNKANQKSPHPSSESIQTLITRSSKTRSSKTEDNRPEDYIQYEEASRAAHQLLINPIQDLLPKNDRDRVIFVPQGHLLLVPFQALQDQQGQYLIQKHTLQIAPSIQTLNLLDHKTKTIRSNPVIVGNPAPMPKAYDPLPGSETEALAIAELFKIKPILGSDATKENVLRQLPNASLIHLATHGTFDDRSGSESAIILANPNSSTDQSTSKIAELNSSLTAAEILNLRLKADLVVLSACNTGRGKINGEGVIGLTRSFLSTGVPSLVVSLWQVPDKPTSSLMVSFHSNRQKGLDKAQALRQAMLTTMEQYPDPTDWAGFMLVGRSD